MGVIDFHPPPPPCSPVRRTGTGMCVGGGGERGFEEFPLGFAMSPHFRFQLGKRRGLITGQPVWTRVSRSSKMGDLKVTRDKRSMPPSECPPQLLELCECSVGSFCCTHLPATSSPNFSTFERWFSMTLLSWPGSRDSWKWMRLYQTSFKKLCERLTFSFWQNAAA